MTPNATIAAWQKQLERVVPPYLERAQIDGYGLQAVLYMTPEGEIGEVKMNILPPKKRHT